MADRVSIANSFGAHEACQATSLGCKKRERTVRFQVCRDALRHKLGLLHRSKVRRGLAKGNDARRGAWEAEVGREEVPVEGGPRPADDDGRELGRLTHR